MKDINEFINTVAEMREAQLHYFRTRQGYFLQESKRLEKEVDRMLEAHYEARRAPELFNEKKEGGNL